MTVTLRGQRIAWYRSPVDREVLASLNQRSDWKGLIQTLGHLGLLALTGAAAFFAAGRLPLAVLLLILFLHGTFWAFLLNGFHELCHKTVFKSKALNTIIPLRGQLPELVQPCHVLGEPPGAPQIHPPPPG